MTSKSKIQTQEVVALFRARNPLLWVVTREEGRVEPFLFEAAAKANYVARTWDVAQGIANIQGQVEVPESSDPGVALNEIFLRATGKKKVDRGVWIMRDMGPWLSGPGGVVTQRQLKNLCRLLPGASADNSQAIVVLTTNPDVPPELVGFATVVTWPLPDRMEMEEIYDTTIEGLPDDIKANAATNGTREAAIDAAVGLTGEEAQACYAKSLVQLKRIDAGAVASEKKRAIAREGVLQWFDPLPGGLDAVGGLDNLKAWLVTRASAYTPEARAYGIRPPRGVFLVGFSGCGKTFVSKAIATAFQCPLIRLDPNALKSKFVGESEQQLRRALDQISTLDKCVVLIDEIEKALQGATSGSSDGGVSADTLGTLLTWMQERSGQAFVVATANDVTALPPELLRKGRFDEMWFVDMPNHGERIEVLKSALVQNDRDLAVMSIDYDAVAKVTDGFSGAEIAALVPESMFTAFNDGGRQIATNDLLLAAKNTVKLSDTAKEKMDALRTWVKQGRARPASAATVTELPAAKAGRVLDSFA